MRGCPVSWLVYAISIVLTANVNIVINSVFPNIPTQVKPKFGSLLWSSTMSSIFDFSPAVLGPVTLTFPWLAQPWPPHRESLFFSSFQTTARKFLDLVSGADILAGNFRPSSLLTQTLPTWVKWREVPYRPERKEKQLGTQNPLPTMHCSSRIWEFS